MIAVIICSVINSGLLLGLTAGIVADFVRARVEIAAAMRFDPLALEFRPLAVLRALPA